MRSPLKTRVMYQPSGFTSARTIDAVDRDLNPAIEGHGTRLLELLGGEQGVGQVDKQPHGHDPGEPIIEVMVISLETIAGDGVANRQREEAEPQGQQN